MLLLLLLLVMARHVQKCTACKVLVKLVCVEIAHQMWLRDHRQEAAQ